MKKVHVPSLLLCLFFLLLLFTLCVLKSDGSLIFARINARPEQTVNDFFNAVKAGNEAEACALLSDYGSLGFEDPTETQETAQLIETLRSSYDFSLSGPSARRGIRANQTVVFSHLDLNAFVSAVVADAQPEEDFSSALQRHTTDANNFITSDILTLNLRYTDGIWKILPDEALFVAIRGGLV